MAKKRFQAATFSKNIPRLKALFGVEKVVFHYPQYNNQHPVFLTPDKHADMLVAPIDCCSLPVMDGVEWVADPE